MTTDVATVDEAAGYRDTVRTLVERRVSALPVLDAERRVVGIVSEEDLLHKEEFADNGGLRAYRPPPRARMRARLGGGGVLAEPAEEKAASTTAAELMTRPAVTVAPTASVVEAARLMEKHGVKRLPVVDDDGRILGIAARRDLLRVFLRTDDDIADAVEREIGVATSAVSGTAAAASVHDGEVTLTGSVLHRSTAQCLTRMTAGLEGVVSVDNRITWQIDDVLPPYITWRTL
ncbi:CBS domain-containing protein [Streptomonospora sp. PA3]|uniref:CBS domain-containing protein n=1 Tax=Streptomonospora sp. PA3 TaxID=2607326 RepID=UPI0021081722|nr:CBS domain-containing protein [Streptomonospora sp. PA3]